MENLRAFMIVNALRECGVELRYYPADLESNSETCQEIIENGFYLAFSSHESAAQADAVLQSQNHIHSYEQLDAPSKSSDEPKRPNRYSHLAVHLPLLLLLKRMYPHILLLHPASAMLR